jgi:NAD(P)H-hydrate epimerase
MENAGYAISKEALKILKKQKGKVAIFCGKGNNGGDGFCAARHLLAAGIKPDIYLVGRMSDVKNEAKVNLDILLRLKQKITEVSLCKISLIKTRIKKYSLIIDALLGVGAKGEIRPVYQQIIDIINSSGIYVLAIDIPSGLDATTGKVSGRCIKANQTVTFVCKKRGMVYAGARVFCGKVLIRNIGLPGAFLLNP